MLANASRTTGVHVLRTSLPALLLLSGAAHFARAQTSPPPSESIDVAVTSGVHANSGSGFRVVFETDVDAGETAAWLRLYFADAHLDGASYIRVTSLHDGHVQQLGATQLDQWRLSTAYFNGSGVTIELVAAPGSFGNYFVLGSMTVGLEPGGGESVTQCGPTDDREASANNAVGRTLPGGCTATIYNAASCMVTAGHCLGGNDVMEFNVPLSNGSGSLNHPGPEDQYSIDLTSRVGVANGVGNDWGHFVCFENSETSSLPFEAQGAMIPLAPEIPAVIEQISITGYGVDTGTANQTQQISMGPVTGISGTTLDHRSDTQGGNSGSSIVDVSTGMTVAIHTHGGCNVPETDSNHGTLISIAGLQAAVSECVGVDVLFPNGTVELIDPANGATVLVEITSVVDAPDPETVVLVYSLADQPFVTVPMADLGNGFYEGVIPPVECASTVRFFVSLTTFGGVTITEPDGAPEQTYVAFGGSAFVNVFEEDFENPIGYTESGDASTGHWEVGVPVDCDRGDPPTDFDGSGKCYLTENDPNDCNSDVDGGSVVLMTPAFDILGVDTAFVRYARWFSNGSSGDDAFVVEISNDDGQNWINLETVEPDDPGADGGWFPTAFNLSEVIPSTSQMRLRFTATDSGGLDVVEAGIDALAVDRLVCDSVDTTPPEIVHDGGITTNPYTGYIDPKIESTDGQTVDLGIETLLVRFSEPVRGFGGGFLTPANFAVTATAGIAPTVQAVDASNNPWVTLTLSGPVPLQAWTTIVADVEDFAGNRIADLGDQGPGVDETDRIDLGFLPADVNQNGVVQPTDLLRFKQIVNGILGNPQGEDADFVDLDRNGSINPLDLLVFKQMILGIGDATQPWNGQSLGPRP